MKDYERIDQLEKDVTDIKSKFWWLISQYHEALEDALNIIKQLKRDRDD